MTQEQLNVSEPLTVTHPSASMTFKDMKKGEIRYFDITHAGMFRIYASRHLDCIVKQGGNAVSVERK